MVPPVRLRPATLDDVDLLHEWDRDPDVVASTGSDDSMYDWATEIPRVFPWREFLVAEVDGEPVGFLQLIDAAEEETHYWGTDVERDVWAIDIWIGAARHRNRGIGAEMMRKALERIFARPEVPYVLIDPLDSNERAHRFYERLGFRFVEHRWFEDDHCRIYRFDRPEP